MLSAYLARLTHHLYKQQCCCETVPGKGSSRACCQNEVSEHYSFLSHFPSFSLRLAHSLGCTLSLQSAGGIRPPDPPQGVCSHTLSVYVCRWVERRGCFSTTDRQKLLIFFLVSESSNHLFHVLIQEYFLELSGNLTWKLPGVSQVVTGKRCLCNNAIIIAIRAQTLGNPEALLDPLVYFFRLVTGMGEGGVALSEFSQHDII